MGDIITVYETTKPNFVMLLWRTWCETELLLV